MDETPLSVPRYRVEERSPNLATFIVGFADTPAQYQSLLARRAAQFPDGDAAVPVPDFWGGFRLVPDDALPGPSTCADATDVTRNDAASHAMLRFIDSSLVNDSNFCRPVRPVGQLKRAAEHRQYAL